MNNSQTDDRPPLQPTPKPWLGFAHERKPWSEAWADRWFSRLAASVSLRPRSSVLEPPSGDETLPLIIGVTGHRDLRAEESPALQEALNQVFTDLQALCPRTPLMLLSPLAEGADRLAAECFLNHPGARLVTPLPLDLDSYRRTFEKESEDFDRLLNRAEQVFLIPDPTRPDVADQPDYRQEPYCYQALGDYLVEHCHILIALWDQVSLGKAGGSAEVIEFQLRGRGLSGGGLEEEFNPSPGRLVIHIQTGRQSSEALTPPVRPGTIDLLIPNANKNAVGRFRLAVNRLDRFNRSTAPGADCRSANSGLWPGERAHDIGPAEKRIEKIQAKTETLAGYWAARLRLRLKALFWGGWLVLFSFQTYRLLHGLEHDSPFWPLILICGLAAAAVLLGYAQAQWGGWQNRHLSYRGLAEALRVQFYWRMLEIRYSAARESFIDESIADFGETDWLRLVLAYTEMMGESQASPTGDRDERHRLARELWIGGQENFFRRKAQQALRKKSFCLWPAIVFLSLGTVWLIFGKFLREIEPGVQAPLLMFLSLIMLGAALEAYHRLSGQVGEHRQWLALTLGTSGILSAAFIFPAVPLSPQLSLFLSTAGLLLLGSGGFLLAYLKLSAHADNSVRYRDYELLFHRAEEMLAQGRRESEVMAFLGRKALTENSVWLRQHLERPLNLPLS